MVWYNYRRIPAVTLIKQVVDEGRLGKIFHYRANFLQDWTINPDVPQGGAGTWRLDVDAAGSASPATCWPIASIRRCGSTARSPAYRR
jgi:predicted dehydrogenase